MGRLQIDLAGGQRRVFLVDGGIAQMKDNKLTVVTKAAWAPEELDATTARAEFAEASARIPTDAKTREDRERQMRRAKLKEEMAASR